MSRSLIGQLRVALGMDSAQFQKGAAQAESRAAKLGKSMQRLGAAMSAVGVGVTLAVRGQLNAADQMGELSEKIGVPVRDLSALAYAGEVTGVSLDQLGNGLRVLSRTMTGNEGKFKALGIEVRDASGQMRPVKDVLYDVADAIQRMPEGAERTALAMQLFGRSGTDMIPMLLGGADAMRKSKIEAEALGVIIDSKTANAAANFNDNLTRLGAAMRGVAMQVAAVLAPVLERISEIAVKLASGFGNLSEPLQRLVAGFAGLTVVLGPVLIGIGLMLPALGALKVALAGALALLTPFAIPIVVIAGVTSLAALGLSKFGASAKEMQTPVEAGATAIQQINEALVGFTAMSPDAQRAALNNAQAYKQQALAAIEAARAEIEKKRAMKATAEAQFPGSGAGIYGAMDRFADDTALKALERGLDQANARIKSVATSITGAVVPAATAGEGSLSDMKVTVEGLGAELDKVGNGGGRAVRAAEGLGRISDVSAVVSDRMSELRSTFESAFVGFVTGAQSARQALSQLAGSLAQMAARGLFQQLFGGLFGGGGGGGGLSLFGGARAEGGPVSRGMAYLVGERGPELFMPGRSGTIIPNDNLAGGAGGAGGTIRVALSEGLVAQILDAAQGQAIEIVQTGLAGYDRSVLPSRVQQISRDPRKVF